MLINQYRHIDKAVERFGLTEARKVSTPLDVTALATDDSCKLEDPKLYQALIWHSQLYCCWHTS